MRGAGVTDEIAGADGVRTPGISRRAALKRGVIVGGLVWTAPVIIDSLSNAAGASPPGSDPPSPHCQATLQFLSPAITKIAGTASELRVQAHAQSECSPKECASTQATYTWTLVSARCSVTTSPAGPQLLVTKKNTKDSDATVIVVKVGVSLTCGGATSAIESTDFTFRFEAGDSKDSEGGDQHRRRHRRRRHRRHE